MPIILAFWRQRQEDQEDQDQEDTAKFEQFNTARKQLKSQVGLNAFNPSI